MNGRRTRGIGVAATLAAMALVGCCSPTLAIAAGGGEAPSWAVLARNFPTNIAPGHVGAVKVEVINLGAGSSAGTVTDELPAGVTALEAGDGGSGPLHEPETFEVGHENWLCTGNGSGAPPNVAGATVVTCTNGPGLTSIQGGAGFEQRPRKLGIKIKVAADATEDAQNPGENKVTVSGGGAPQPANFTDPIAISSQPAAFGLTGLHTWFSNADGTADTQAGSHPYAFMVSFGFNTDLEKDGEADDGDGVVRNIEVELPPGFVGDPSAAAQCTRQEFLSYRCPSASEVGVENVENWIDLEFHVYNLVPPPGVPAEFGFHFETTPVYIDTGVRSGGDYGLTSVVDDAPELETHNSTLILWGNPAVASHDRWRQRVACKEACGEESIPKPLLTLPTQCAGPGVFAVKANDWEQSELAPAEASTPWLDAGGNPTGLTGCEQLSFGPGLTIAPDTANADTPAGLTAEVRPTTGGLTEAEGFSTSDIEDTTVTLPAGVAINPGQAAGLVTCPETEATLKRDNEAPACPNAAKVGTVEIVTPLLVKPLQGNVYILAGDPPNLRLLVAASGEGVNVKLIGHVHLDEATGQLQATFSNTPELPFTDFKLAFSGGAQAALATPARCGVYTAQSDFTPWSSPFVADATSGAQFAITSGTDGAPCPAAGALPYTPTLTAGATTDQAGGYTDFSLLLQAPDGQQRTSRLQFKTPEGLLGMISRVTLCTNAQAEANACPASSQIGHTTVASGPGPYPLVVPQPGQSPAPIYLTEGYEGAPYGLSIVVPLDVGPFTLPTQRVRAKIEVNPITAQLTVTTDPLPQYVAGVPTDLRSIDAVIDRPGFMFNPTGCTPRPFSGTAYGSEGAQVAIATPFQMGSCRALAFKPNFKASTSGRTSRADGASLAVKIVYPTGPLGANQASSQSNIQSIKVELPKRLPSRLTTLQKACTAAQFNVNPAGCPAASVVGHATAITPVLPVPLTGPAYFVSNGNESFPNLIIVLQGYGVTVHLVGDTFISKQGITSSTFKQVPDVPIASFELKLPEGPYSALAANGNLCKSKLAMPTHFVAQNGAELQQSTPITTSGCAKAKPQTKKVTHTHSKQRGKRRAGKQGTRG